MLTQIFSDLLWLRERHLMSKVNRNLTYTYSQVWGKLRSNCGEKAPAAPLRMACAELLQSCSSQPQTEASPEANDGFAGMSVAWGSEFIFQHCSSVAWGSEFIFLLYYILIPTHLYLIPFHPGINLNQIRKHLRPRHQLSVPRLPVIRRTRQKGLHFILV